MSKFYAVKKGKTTGIYTDWETCKVQVNGFSGAQYKSFKTRSEAEAYMNHGAPVVFTGDYYTLKADGGCRGNGEKNSTGAVGGIICDGNKKIASYLGCLSSVTNNEAEYQSVIEGLLYARDLGIKSLKVMLDSNLIVQQVNGVYSVRAPNLKAYYERVKELMKDFDDVTFSHIYREHNTEADALCNEAMDNDIAFTRR